LLFLIPVKPTSLEAQESSGQSIRRLTYCIPTRPYLPTSEEPTLCAQYPNLTEQTADVIIGSTTTVTKASDLTSSTWFDKEIIIKGKFVIDQPTWFVRCIVKMAPASEIEVTANNRMFTVFSKFFACTQMWKGITLLQDGDADIWHTEIQDAGVALRTTKDNVISIVGSRFNRNHIGVQSRLTSSTSPSVFPTTFSPSYFSNNEFTVTSALNAPYTGQTFHPTFQTIGMEILNTTANLVGPSATYSNRFTQLDCGIDGDARSNISLGFAEFENQHTFGVNVENQSRLSIPLVAPCFFANNFVSGISSVASGLDVNGCRFEGDDSQNYGVISSAVGGNTFDINIRDCRFLMQGVANSAIALERGVNNSIRVEANYIEVESPSPANGIYVYTPIGVSSTGGECRVNRDTIVFDDNPSDLESNFGIKVVGSGGSIVEISGNVLELRTDKSEISGIILENGLGLSNRISGNIIYNPPYSQAYNTSEVGIEIMKTRRSEVCNNIVSNTQVGIRFFGDNDFSRLKENDFLYHNLGLFVYGDQFVPNDPNAFNPAIIGVQFRGANTWIPYGDGTKTGDAAFGGGDFTQSRMRIHSANPEFFPPFFDITPPSWFIPDFGTPVVDCSGDSFQPGTLDSIVANGSYFVPTSTPLVRWEMKRRLMYEILRDTNYGGTYAPFDTFYTNNLSTNAGKFAKVDWDLHKVGDWNASLRTALNALEGQHQLYLDTLVNLSAGTAVLPDTVTLIDPVLAQAKTAVLTQMKTLHQQYFALTHAHDSLHRVALQTIRTFNSSITAVHAFEVNQKVINEIAIKEALGEALTVSDMTALENIAAQPDSIAGSTPRTAANMLFPCVEHSAGPRAYDFESIPNTTVEDGQRYWVLSPNPSSGLAQLAFSTPYTGAIKIIDQLGRVVLQNRIQEQAIVHIQCADWPNGLYWIHAVSPAGEQKILKMVVLH
jgi:hypothetical protein